MITSHRGVWLPMDFSFAALCVCSGGGSVLFVVIYSDLFGFTVIKSYAYCIGMNGDW